MDHRFDAATDERHRPTNAENTTGERGTDPPEGGRRRFLRRLASGAAVLTAGFAPEVGGATPTEAERVTNDGPTATDSRTGHATAGTTTETSVGARTETATRAPTDAPSPSTATSLPDLSVRVDRRGATSLDVAWEAPPSASAEAVRYEVTTPDPVATVPSVATTRTGTRVQASPFTVYGLSPDRPYHVVATAVDGEGQPVASGWLRARTNAFDRDGVEAVQFGTDPDHGFEGPPWTTLADATAPFYWEDHEISVSVDSTRRIVDVVGGYGGGNCHDLRITDLQFDDGQLTLRVAQGRLAPNEPCWSERVLMGYRCRVELDADPSAVRVVHGDDEWAGRWTSTAGTIPSITDAAPTDPDDDGVYEDVTGNGEIDNRDLVEFFEQMDDADVRDRPTAFDASGNGAVDYRDLVALFQDF